MPVKIKPIYREVENYLPQNDFSLLQEVHIVEQARLGGRIYWYIFFGTYNWPGRH
jgi:hypothetical protein